MLTIKRQKDSRIVKSILHRCCDIPGGVTVKTSELGGSVLFEGTALGYSASDGMYHVAKTATIITNATNSATTYEVAKGHHFKVGDVFATEGANGQTVTVIDKSDASKDVITVGTTLGVAISAGVVAFQANATGGKVVKYPPIGVAGSSYDVDGTNLFVDIWVVAVVRAGLAPKLNDTVSATMKGVIFVN